MEFLLGQEMVELVGEVWGVGAKVAVLYCTVLFCGEAVVRREEPSQKFSDLWWESCRASTGRTAGRLELEAQIVYFIFISFNFTTTKRLKQHYL